MLLTEVAQGCGAAHPAKSGGGKGGNRGAHDGFLGLCHPRDMKRGPPQGWRSPAAAASVAPQSTPECGLGWYSNVFEVIDMRSFSSLWYWIALAVMWSSASHYVLGVPFDLVQRARRRGGQAPRT
jgi:hypothetical protein